MASTGLSAVPDEPGTVVSNPGPRTRPGPASPLQDGSRDAGPAILDAVDPIDRLRLAGKRMTDPLESLAQRVAERVIDLVVDVLDLNALVQAIDLNAVLNRIDINEILQNVDVSALVDRVDINDVLQRVDVGALLDRWVQRALRRKQPAPSMPPALLDGQPMAGQPPDAQAPDAQVPDTEAPDAQPPDAQPPDARARS